MKNDPMHINIEAALATTQLWLDQVIIKEKFCPFAKPVRDNNQIHFSIQQQSDVATLLRQLVIECEDLLRNDKIETSLLIYTDAFTEFHDYLDFLEMANELIENAGFEGILQLASFHPDYLFEGAPTDCPSNFTNRSPLPMLHLLREDSITEALDAFAHPESIPKRNIDHAKTLGEVFFKKYLANSIK